jgi:hypothetical protein
MRRLSLAALAVALTAMSPLARADDVVLKNGRTIRGHVIEHTAETVVIDIGGGTVTLRASQVAEVRRDISWKPERVHDRSSSPVIEKLVKDWNPNRRSVHRTPSYSPRYRPVRVNDAGSGMAGRRRNNSRPASHR